MAKPKTFEHYEMCSKCAIDMGGKFINGHVCTATFGECPYCHTKDVYLIPRVDFNWPKDEKLDKIAKGNRD